MKSEELLKDIKQKLETTMEHVTKNGIDANNLGYLYKLMDIHKDIANEEYWKIKEENLMRYDAYRAYSNSYGEGSYGRRGRDSRGRYTGPEDKIDDMYMNYQAYSEGREAYGRSGNYSAKEDSMMCLENMLESMVDFVKMLREKAGSQEEMEIINKYVKKLSEG